MKFKIEHETSDEEEFREIMEVIDKYSPDWSKKVCKIVDIEGNEIK